MELTRKTEARVSAILRQLLAAYDDVVYRAAPGGGDGREAGRRRSRPGLGPDLREALSAAGAGCGGLTGQDRG